jgi:hypothetical protein
MVGIAIFDWNRSCCGSMCRCDPGLGKRAAGSRRCGSRHACNPLACVVGRVAIDGSAWIYSGRHQYRNWRRIGRKRCLFRLGAASSWPRLADLACREQRIGGTGICALRARVGVTICRWSRALSYLSLLLAILSSRGWLCHFLIWLNAQILICGLII